MLHIGTGSWADPDYKKLLTAPGVPARERLRAYAAWFNHVEVNSSYYATPKPETAATWVEQTPAGFTFDIKLHRILSQSPKSAASNTLVETLLAGVEPLITANKLGAFLLVLPPRFTPDNHSLDELDTLVEKLRPHPLAVELRHSAWVDGDQRAETLAWYKARGVTWVAVDMPRIKGSTLMPPLDEVTTPGLAYLRLHGRNPGYLEAKTAAEGHDYAYTARELTDLAKRIRGLEAKATHVHVIANNHAHDYAPKTALSLRARLGGGSSEE